MSSSMEDLAAEAAAAPPIAASLEDVRSMGSEVLELNDQIVTVEAMLKRLTERRTQLLTRDMVDAMDGAHCPSITVGELLLTCGPYFHANIPEDSQDEAHDWLEANGGGDIVKNTVTVQFPKDFQDEAEALEKYARENYQMATTERRRAVPWATLTKFVREWTEAAPSDKNPRPALPLKLLGATIGRVVRMKQPKG